MPARVRLARWRAGWRCHEAVILRDLGYIYISTAHRSCAVLRRFGGGQREERGREREKQGIKKVIDALLHVAEYITADIDGVWSQYRL